MTKADFVWTVGFSGNKAVVNRGQRGARRAPAWDVLLKDGYLRAAFCSALWEAEKAADSTALEACAAAIGAKVGRALTVDETKRMLGVYQVPADNVRVLAV